MLFWNKQTKIQFKCDPRIEATIPRPYQAKKYIPKWYKQLQTHFNTDNKITPVPTLKRCPPFLDAMSAGWIIPLVAEVHIRSVDGGTGVRWETDFFLPLIENHYVGQVQTHPKSPRIPLKFMNHWIVQTPPGWSTLFVPPLNRPDSKIELFSGIVETDKYFEYVNFPGYLKLDEGHTHLERGYPLMQAIPFKRDYDKECEISSLTLDEVLKLQHTRDRKMAEFSYYRDNLWEKK